MTLARARTAVGAAFLAQGLVFISLTTRLPRLQDRWDLDELALSGLLLMMVLLAGGGSVLAERAAERHDSARLLRLGLLLVAVGVPVLPLGVAVSDLPSIPAVWAAIDAGHQPLLSYCVEAVGAIRLLFRRSFVPYAARMSPGKGDSSEELGPKWESIDASSS